MSADVYATGEVPAIGDVVATTAGTEYTVYAYTGTAIYASAANGEANFDSAPHIYTLVRRKGGAGDAPAGTGNVADLREQIGDLREVLESSRMENDSLLQRIVDLETLLEAPLRRQAKRSVSAGSTSAEETVAAGGSPIR